MMATRSWEVNWDSGMSVGIAEIDEDHKRFIALVNEFNKSVENRLGVSEVQRILRDILDDAIEHFANEERLLGEWRYPGAHDHARAHAELVLQLRQIESAISSDYDVEW